MDSNGEIVAAFGIRPQLLALTLAYDGSSLNLKPRPVVPNLGTAALCYDLGGVVGSYTTYKLDDGTMIDLKPNAYPSMIVPSEKKLVPILLPVDGQDHSKCSPFAWPIAVGRGFRWRAPHYEPMLQEESPQFPYFGCQTYGNQQEAVPKPVGDKFHIHGDLYIPAQMDSSQLPPGGAWTPKHELDVATGKQSWKPYEGFLVSPQFWPGVPVA